MGELKAAIDLKHQFIKELYLPQDNYTCMYRGANRVSSRASSVDEHYAAGRYER